MLSTEAIIIIIVNVFAIIFAAGILYGKVNSQCKRVMRIEALIDRVIMNYGPWDGAERRRK
jgi:hypothetical protein